MFNDESMPRIIKNSETVLELLGFGILRCIHLEKKLFYIQTCVDSRKLQRVNVLAKGDFDLPACFLFSQVQQFLRTESAAGFVSHFLIILGDLRASALCDSPELIFCWRFFRISQICALAEAEIAEEPRKQSCAVKSEAAETGTAVTVITFD